LEHGNYRVTLLILAIIVMVKAIGIYGRLAGLQARAQHCRN